MVLHICPVCGKTHAVNPARDSVSWGRQLTCSVECESERRRRIRKQLLGAYSLRASDGR